jgi:hypothetical protein
MQLCGDRSLTWLILMKNAVQIGAAPAGMQSVFDLKMSEFESEHVLIGCVYRIEQTTGD